MAKYRSDVRIGIREKLSAWPLNATTLSAAVTTTTATTVTLTSVLSITERSLIEVDSELMHVLSVAGFVATVMRGARGTTAATHLNGAAVNIYPEWGWPDANLNRKISRAITWLGEGQVYTLTPLTNTLLSGYKEFGLPSGCEYPNGNKLKVLEILQADGTYKKSLFWKHQGDRIVLPNKLTESLSVRLWIETKQADLTDDTTALGDARYLEVLELYASARALEELLANRTRYTEYSASLHDRASSLDELQRQAYYFQNQAIILRNEMSRPGLSGQASFHPT